MNNKKNLALKSSVITTTITLAMISLSSVSASESQISNSEKSSIQNFLNEQPSNGFSKKITTNTAPESDLNNKNSQYKFPGITDYKSIIQSRYLKQIDPDNSFYEKSYRLHTALYAYSYPDSYRIVSVDGMFEQSEPNNEPDIKYIQSYYAKKITVINTTNNQKSTYTNVLISKYYDDIQLGGSAWINDIAIEESDPRFVLTINNYGRTDNIWNWFSFNQMYDKNEYWTLTVPDITYEDYDTIVKIDESLKSGQEIIDNEGQYGKQEDNYEIIPPVNSSINSEWYKKDFNSDLIIKNLIDLQKANAFKNSKVQQSENNDFSIIDNVGKYTAPHNRIIRVGIDYTKYVDTLGNEISPEYFGLHDKKEISGYYFLETKKETNGDTIHVYAKQGSLVVNYVDKDGNKLATSDNESGNIDSSYTTKPKEISGYKLVETPSNANGTYTDVTTTVSYVYEKEQQPVIKQAGIANPEKSVLGNAISQHEVLNSNKKDTSFLLPHTSVNNKNQDSTPLISVLVILSGIVGLNLFTNKKKNK